MQQTTGLVLAHQLDELVNEVIVLVTPEALFAVALAPSAGGPSYSRTFIRASPLVSLSDELAAKCNDDARCTSHR
jgi:hypothetical protein